MYGDIITIQIDAISLMPPAGGLVVPESKTVAFYCDSEGRMTFPLFNPKVTVNRSLLIAPFPTNRQQTTYCSRLGSALRVTAGDPLSLSTPPLHQVQAGTSSVADLVHPETVVVQA